MKLGDETLVSKTDYLLFRECAKNAWLKLHKQDVFYASELSDFEKSIIETGNEVELEARKLFPNGVLVEGRDRAAADRTKKLIEGKEKAIFQAAFEKDGFFAAVDVLEWNDKAGAYDLHEIKASNGVKDDWHPYDLAFQMNLLARCGVKVNRGYILHLNPEYVRSGPLDLQKAFKKADLTDEVAGLMPAVEDSMAAAQEFLRRDREPEGCDCVYKSRSNHCATFRYSNPQIPDYGIHDLARVSKKKLVELVDSGILDLADIPEDFELSTNQRNQVDMAVRKAPLIVHKQIAEELGKLQYPLYFLDYETFPAALPRFDGFGTYQQIPFQYSLHILEKEGEEPVHKEFLYLKADDPSRSFGDSLRENIGDAGTVIVWYKPFECGRNRELAERLPDLREFLQSVEDRVFDLRDIFTKQLYVHKDFKGGTSIKKVLPVLAPDFSYKKLAIREGGTASMKWDEMVNGALPQAEKDEIAANLLEYCKLDTYAMYAIWKHLAEL